MLPCGYPYVFVITPKYIVSMLSLRYSIIHDPRYHHLFGRFSLPIVYGLEYATSPLAIPFYSVFIAGFIWALMSQKTFRAYISQMI